MPKITKTKRVKAWGVVYFSLMNPFDTNYAYAIYENKGRAKFMAETWSNSSGRNYTVVPVEITYKVKK